MELQNLEKPPKEVLVTIWKIRLSEYISRPIMKTIYNRKKLIQIEDDRRKEDHSIRTDFQSDNKY